MIKITSISLVFFMLTLLAIAQQNTDALNIEVSLKAESITKSRMLDTLGSKYNIHFSYNPELINAGEILSVNIRRKPLYSVLQNIINPNVLNFKAFDNQIVFFPVQNTPGATETDDTLQFIVITGTVFDEDKKNNIPYCNISIVGKALGTMTNSLGEFTVKIPLAHKDDTLGFSSIGYEVAYFPVSKMNNEHMEVPLSKKTYTLREINVIRYNPTELLNKTIENFSNNYENDYTLLTNYYREITLENNEYTDISEAVLQVMKAPYSNEIKQDHVKFLKGRKGTETRPQTDIRFKLMGGPYYITKLDIVKNNESFINPEFRHLYHYDFDRITIIDNRETAVISFKPVYSLRDILYEGNIYIDTETYAITRVEFQYTKQGLKEARSSLVHKEPRRTRVVPTSLEYTVQYKLIDGKWYLLSARSSFQLRMNNRAKKEKTDYHSISELVTTNIEKGDFQKFGRKEIFRPNEIFTDKIVSYDKEFWKDYNVIHPEDRLVDALKKFDNRNLFITYKN
jgi:hypothetical protein